MKKDFKPYKIGTVFNSLGVNYSGLIPAYKGVEVNFPSRLNAMALDPSKITSNNNLVYTPGEIIFVVKIYSRVTIEISNKKGEIRISSSSPRHSLINHVVFLMRKALAINDGFYISVEKEDEIKHCGLGSSSNLIAAVAVAINELYGNPIDLETLAKYVAQNHGEEIEGEDNYIMPVQSIGGSAIGGFFDGGMKVITGETCLIKSMDISRKYKVVLGIPKDFQEKDARELLDMEINNFDKFFDTGLKFKNKIAYNVLHKLLPAMTTGDLGTIGDIIFDYRFNMGSIENCSFVYSKLPEVTGELVPLKKKKIAEILAISSVGPGIFSITKEPRFCEDVFKANNLETKVVELENKKYTVKRR